MFSSPGKELGGWEGRRRQERKEVSFLGGFQRESRMCERVCCLFLFLILFRFASTSVQLVTAFFLRTRLRDC